MENIAQKLLLIGGAVRNRVNLPVAADVGQEQLLLRTAAEIRQEATRSNQSAAGGPCRWPPTGIPAGPTTKDSRRSTNCNLSARDATFCPGLVGRR